MNGSMKPVLRTGELLTPTRATTGSCPYLNCATPADIAIPTTPPVIPTTPTVIPPPHRHPEERRISSPQRVPPNNAATHPGTVIPTAPAVIPTEVEGPLVAKSLALHRTKATTQVV
jgi:hypothetical protein